MAQTLQKNIRVTPGQWDRIEKAAEDREVSANQLVIELAMEALDRSEWPATETEIRVARASLFTAQALARNLIADGREPEVQEIREFISTIVPMSLTSIRLHDAIMSTLGAHENGNGVMPQEGSHRRTDDTAPPA